MRRLAIICLLFLSGCAELDIEAGDPATTSSAGVAAPDIQDAAAPLRPWFNGTDVHTWTTAHSPSFGYTDGGPCVVTEEGQVGSIANGTIRVDWVPDIGSEELALDFEVVDKEGFVVEVVAGYYIQGGPPLVLELTDVPAGDYVRFGPREVRVMEVGAAVDVTTTMTWSLAHDGAPTIEWGGSNCA